MAPSGDRSDDPSPCPVREQVPQVPSSAAGHGDDMHSNTTGDASWEQEYSLRKYLLLLAMVVATVTYTAGFSPPGSVWEESDPAAGYTAGDPIIRHTSYRRYVAFFYLNAAAFGSSLVVIVLVLIISIRHDKKSGSRKAVHVLRVFMVLDLLSIVGAYTAGIYRKRDVPVYSMILAALTIVYVVVFHMVLRSRPPSCRRPASGGEAVPSGEPAWRFCKEYERPRKVLLLLATFAVSVTYVAGLSAPGGFRDDYEGGHVPGEPVLMGGRHETRLKAFVNFNSTAFFFSLLIAVQLVDKNLRIKDGEEVRDFRYYLLYGSIVLALLGLVCAYATGSSRDRDTTIYVTLLGVAVPACITLVRVLLHLKNKGPGGYDEEHNNQNQEANSDGGEAEDKARSLVLLLATLAATITYQAGLDPPGGLWESNGSGYVAGDPIMRTMSPRRYDAFFYCNSGAFVASLVAIILVRKRLFKLETKTTTNALQAAMILDLFGLIGAYAAGSCRDVSTSIYAMALAGAVLIYVVIHVVFFTLDHKDASAAGDGEAVLEKRRKRLLLFAILAATITYQAGLTPPGGFWVRDEAGHRAGDPVLQSNFPHRYRAFFYCNSVSFMLSIALIILLVNPNLYRPAIRSNALSVCTAAGTFSLVGAFATGSTHYLRTSIKIFGLVAAILVMAILALGHLHHVNDDGSKDNSADDGNSTHDGVASDYKKDKQRHAWRKHLMVLGILVASITYQAGLEPPGGVWQDDDDGLGHVAGNPIMRDNGRTRYLAFFYTNSTSFVASVVVIILLLLNPASNKAITEKLGQWFNDAMDRGEDEEFEWWMSAMNTTIELDLLGLLVAYAVGSTRSWKATGYVLALVFSVLAYIAVHGMLASRINSRSDPKQGGQVGQTNPASPIKTNQETCEDV